MEGPSTTRVERYVDPTAFLDAVGTYLARREAEHNLIFGICSNLAASGTHDTDAYLGVVWRDRRPIGAAVMTPPWNPVLAQPDEADRVEVAAALVDDLRAGAIAVPGVLGPREVARAFAERWCSSSGQSVRTTLRERIYRIERVVPPRAVPGAVRIATEADRATLVAFADAFMREALDRDDGVEAEGMVDRGLRLGQRTFYLWEDGVPVSLAGAGGPTPNGIRIGPVYTRPEARGRGYASAVTAAATQAQLDSGRRFVFLFTDLANPTANRIYRAIGYEPVIDVDQLTFEPAIP